MKEKVCETVTDFSQYNLDDMIHCLIIQSEYMGEEAVFTSHHATLQEVLEQSIEVAWVLEDGETIASMGLQRFIAEYDALNGDGMPHITIIDLENDMVLLGAGYSY